MANQIEDRLIELINLASVEADGSKKVDLLYQIKELALNHEHNLSIENFFHDILAFQNDRSPNVRKFVLTFIEAACKVDCRLCPKALLSLSMLLNDTNTDVVKRSIQTATQFYRALAQWIASHNNSNNNQTTGNTATTNDNDDTKPPAAANATSGGLHSGQSPSSPQQMGSTSPAALTVKIEPGSPTPQQQQSNQQQQPVSPQNQLQQFPVDEMKVVPTPSGDNSLLSNEIVKTWAMWLQIKNLVCSLLESTNNDGVRTQSIKFIETIVLLQTPIDKYTDKSHELNLIDPMIMPIKIADELISNNIAGLPRNGVLFNEEHKLELVEAAKKRFQQLVVFHGTSHISSVNLMATMQSLVILAKQRYRLFMGRVIQAMETLNSRLPPTLTESQVQSVRKFLKVQLTVMLKHPYALERFQPQITQLLQAVGSRPVEISKVINDFKHKFGCGDPLSTNNNSNEAQKRIKLESGLRSQTTNVTGSQASLAASQAKAKHLDFNKLTQELDEKEKKRIVVESVKRILGEEKRNYISPPQMEIKKKVLSTLANEFNNTDCPQIIQDYIFGDLQNRHEICYAIIKKNFDLAVKKATKRQINLFDHQDLLKNYFDCFNSYLERAMDLKDSKDRDIILPKLYALRDEYYNLSNQDQEQEDEK